MRESGNNIWGEKKLGCEWGKDKNLEKIGKVLLREFQDLLSENPPLKGEFCPQKEIQKIKKLSRQERKEALNIFKNKLERQRDGWASCRVFLERIIEFDNDPPRDYLLEWVHLFGKNYGFTESHYNLTEKIIDAFYKEREKCLEFLNRYHDNLHKAASKLTRTKLNKEEIDVTAGPVSINITADGKEYNKINEKEKLSRDTLGFFKTDLFTEIGYAVIKGGRESKKTKTHEEEHAKNRLLFRFLHGEGDVATEKIFLEIDLKKEKDEEKREKIFKKYIKLFQREALLRAKSEITARKRDGSEINSSLFFNVPAYDYLKNIKAEYGGKKEGELINKILVEEYREILNKAIWAFNALEMHGHKTDKVIAFFTDKNLEEWSKTAQDIIKETR